MLAKRLPFTVVQFLPCLITKARSRACEQLSQADLKESFRVCVV
jgi:hypothetical protein